MGILFNSKFMKKARFNTDFVLQGDDDIAIVRLNDDEELKTILDTEEGQECWVLDVEAGRCPLGKMIFVYIPSIDHAITCLERYVEMY